VGQAGGISAAGTGRRGPPAAGRGVFRKGPAALETLSRSCPPPHRSTTPKNSRPSPASRPASPRPRDVHCRTAPPPSWAGLAASGGGSRGAAGRTRTSTQSRPSKSARLLPPPPRPRAPPDTCSVMKAKSRPSVSSCSRAACAGGSSASTDSSCALRLVLCRMVRRVGSRVPRRVSPQERAGSSLTHTPRVSRIALGERAAPQ
jgi:hypothetical protein